MSYKIFEFRFLDIELHQFNCNFYFTNYNKKQLLLTKY